MKFVDHDDQVPGTLVRINAHALGTEWCALWETPERTSWVSIKHNTLGTIVAVTTKLSKVNFVMCFVSGTIGYIEPDLLDKVL